MVIRSWSTSTFSTLFLHYIIDYSPSFLLLSPQAAITSNNKTTSTLNKSLVPAPNMGKASTTKSSNYLDVRPTVLQHYYQESTTILGAVPSNTPILDANNTTVEPTEEFNSIVYNTTESLLFITTPI